MSFLMTSLIMLAFWIILSGEFTPLLLGSGVAASLLVAYLSHDLLIGQADLGKKVCDIGRFVKYLPWLFWQIILANLDLVYRVLHPRMPIDPGFISFKNDFETQIGMVTLANSITLTPGTVTVDVTDQEFIVHVIARKPAEELLKGEMMNRVKRIGANGA